LTEDGKIYLKKIIDASHRMQIMINDLLSISMITGDRSFEPFSLQTILEEVKQTLEYKIEQKNAIIEGNDLPEAKIIPSQFRQLFQNLLSNSLKFTRDDVQPHIIIKSTYLTPEEIGDLQLTKAARYLKLDFIDNGIGFENEFASKIFQIFQRLHGRSEYEGTGIGLAICKKIAEHHSGVIYAKGQAGKGATFTILLPS
jgi:signal transduction histidine kinase